MQSHDISNNKEGERFEFTEGNQTAFLEYKLSDTAISILHTDVPDSLGGRGIGSALVTAAFDLAQQEKIGVKVYCTFAGICAKKHPEWSEIIIPKK